MMLSYLPLMKGGEASDLRCPRVSVCTLGTPFSPVLTLYFVHPDPPTHKDTHISPFHFISLFLLFRFFLFFSGVLTHLKFPAGHKVLHPAEDFNGRPLGVGQPARIKLLNFFFLLPCSCTCAYKEICCFSFGEEKVFTHTGTHHLKP